MSSSEGSDKVSSSEFYRDKRVLRRGSKGHSRK